MASKDQTFKKYALDFKLKIIAEKQAGASYTELSRKYSIPDGTIATWVHILKRDGMLDIAQRGRPTDQEMDYKERYEILKKFQGFLDKKGQKKR
jgi:transposase-like protein